LLHAGILHIAYVLASIVQDLLARGAIVIH
jgi:hypothetical protein